MRKRILTGSSESACLLTFSGERDRQNTVKAKNIQRNSRISLCVDDETPPYAYMMIEGTATLSDDLNALLYWATRIGGRYMGEDLAEAYGRRNGVLRELLGRITPTKVIFEENIAS